MDYFQGRYTIQNIKEVVSTSQTVLAKVVMVMVVGPDPDGIAEHLLTRAHLRRLQIHAGESAMLERFFQTKKDATMRGFIDA